MHSCHPLPRSPVSPSTCLGLLRHSWLPARLQSDFYPALRMLDCHSPASPVRLLIGLLAAPSGCLPGVRLLAMVVSVLHIIASRDPSFCPARSCHFCPHTFSSFCFCAPLVFLLYVAVLVRLWCGVSRWRLCMHCPVLSPVFFCLFVVNCCRARSSDLLPG